MAGIIGLGAYVPRLRLQRKAIVDAHVWADPALAGKAKGERAICNWDEDPVTMALEAARDCLGEARPAPDLVLFASTSMPFADRQNAGIVTTALGLEDGIATLDVTASQRAGTSALRQALAAVGSSEHDHALVVGAEQRRARAASPGELAWGDGGAAVLVGRDDPALEYLGGHTATVDFVDHFRAAGEAFDYAWEERWIRDEGYGRIVPGVLSKALERAGVAAADVAHFVLPATVGRAVATVAKKAGIAPEAIVDPLHGTLGETGAAHPLVMLAHACETRVAPGDVVLVAGFGQGCDALVFRATDRLPEALGARGVSGWLAAGVPETNYQKYLAFNDLVELEKGMRAENWDYKTPLTVTYRKRDMLTALVGGRCTQCGTLQFPRTDVCVNPQCRATHTQEPHPFRDEPASVLTWSADYLTYIPSPPSHYGMITFANGGRFMTDFTDVDVGELDVGMAVELRFRIKSVDRRRGFVRYFWKAVPVRTAQAPADAASAG
jgi:3-hydroxy-3-methylglutaryl CoA synthase